ncbi:MAG: zinc-ribbon domain-containing protein [Candidatus Acidiferrales bacterium]
MYCDRCGTQLRDSAQFCSNCGKQLATAPVPMARPAVAPIVVAPAWDGRVTRHLKILASLWLVYAILRLMGAFWFFVIGHAFLPGLINGWMGDGPWGNGWPFAHGFPFGIFGGGIEFWFAGFAVLEIITAWGLFERRPWARILALVLGFLTLLHFPFGTALGIYTLWVLLPGAAGQEYEQLGHPQRT